MLETKSPAVIQTVCFGILSGKGRAAEPPGMARPVAAELLRGGNNSQRLQIRAIAPQPRSHQLLIGKHFSFTVSLLSAHVCAFLPSFGRIH